VSGGEGSSFWDMEKPWQKRGAHPSPHPCWVKLVGPPMVQPSNRSHVQVLHPLVPPAISTRGCHGYITEEYIHALYPYPLRIRAGDAYSKCMMRKRGEDISILSDKNCKIISDPYSRYERRDTGI